MRKYAHFRPEEQALSCAATMRDRGKIAASAIAGSHG
jgi:hypothetical protein